ncbi:MAG: hypothetical protein KDJ65_38560 [Anaerolineae bacterium]|nr:hypothetical protein [Anaerolineae bacterium]
MITTGHLRAEGSAVESQSRLCLFVKKDFACAVCIAIGGALWDNCWEVLEELGLMGNQIDVMLHLDKKM